MTRKTFDVSDLIDKVNAANRTGTQSKDMRAGQNSLLESVLHETGNYKGFVYLASTQIPPGQEAGVIQDKSSGEVFFPDETRRLYIK